MKELKLKTDEMDVMLNLRVAEVEDLETKLREQSSENEKLKETCGTLETELQEARLRLQELKVDLNLSNSSIEQLEEKLKARDSQLNGLASTEAELKDIMNKSQEIEDMLRSRDLENQELNKKLLDNSAELESEMAELQSDLRKSMVKNKELDALLTMKENENQTLERKVNEYNKQKTELEDRASQLANQLADVETTRLQELKTRLSLWETENKDWNSG